MPNLSTFKGDKKARNAWYRNYFSTRKKKRSHYRKVRRRAGKTP